MIVRIVLRGFTLLFIFLGLWFGMKQIDWVKILQIEKVASQTEEKLGDLYWKIISSTEKEIKRSKATDPIEKLVEHICVSNNLEPKIVKVHLIDKSMVNAFALPDHHLVLHTGLIEDCNDESELAGVISHEIAHMELNHVMKTLVKEVGLSVLISASAGGGGEVIKSTLKTLSSSAYSRTLESEADLQGVDYMLEAHLDPMGLSRFLQRLGREESQLLKDLSWISTHPESGERASAINSYLSSKTPDINPVLSEGEWKEFKDYINTNY